MQKTYQDLYEDCQNQTVDSDATSLTFFKTKLNEGISKAYTMLDSEYFYGTSTDLTEEDINSYPLPSIAGKMVSMKVEVSDVDYPVVEFPGDENAWILLTGGVSSTSSGYPQYFFIKRNTIEIYPTSSTAGYTITYRFKRNTKALSVANFTTESIKTAVVGSTAIVGNTGTTWTASMAGRFIKITSDGIWYEIASVTDATNLVLARNWSGTAITAGTEEYIIGEGSLLPFDFQEAPVNYTLWKYYLLKEKSTLAKDYKLQWLEDLENLKRYGGNDTTSGVLTENVIIRDPNNYPRDLE